MNNIIIVLCSILATASAEAIDYSCCKGQGVLQHDQKVCVHNVTGDRSPINMSCKDTFRLPLIFEYEITESGVMLLYMGGTQPLDYGTYCIANGTSNTTDQVVIICGTEEEVDEENEYTLGYCMLFSSVFLTLTVLVYCILPEIRDLQGKSIISLCTCLGIGLCILGGMKVTEYSDMDLCAARGFFLYFFLLASFFWSNAIAIQMLLNIRHPTAADYGWRRFSWYALYAFGTPALLTVAMAIVNYLPGHHSKPGIGLNTCWFYQDNRQQWYYMYSVMSILLTANIAIVIYLSLHFCRVPHSSSHIKGLRYKFLMTVRMIIVLGLTWVFEMISALCSPHIIWSITDFFNGLQGLLMFLVLVVFRRRVIKALYKRGYLDCISGVVERHLAVGDDEEDVVEHTIDVPFEEKSPKKHDLLITMNRDMK